MGTNTYRRLYDAELERTGSASRAAGRAVLITGVMRGVADGQRISSRASFFRYKAVLRAARIAPVETPAALASLGRDLGVSSRAGLARLLWTLNSTRSTPAPEKRSIVVMEQRHAAIIADALALLLSPQAIPNKEVES